MKKSDKERLEYQAPHVDVWRRMVYYIKVPCLVEINFRNHRI